MARNGKRLWVVLAALAFYLAFVWRTSFSVAGRRYFVLFEDAMISMRYAQHFAAGEGFVWNHGEPPIEGFTNWLWVFWMSLAHKIGMAESKVSLFIMLSGVLIMLGVGFFTGRIARFLSDAPWVPLACVAASLFCYPLVFWTLRGMEVGALTLIVYALVWCVLENERSFSVARTALMSLLAGAAFLVRTDSVVAVGVIGLYGLWTAKKRVLFAVIMAGGLGAAVLAQLQYRRTHFDDRFPNTYYLKLYGIKTSAKLKRGVFVALQVLSMHLAVPLSIVGAVLGVRFEPRALLALLKKEPKARIKLLLCTIFGMQVAYAVYVGGDAWEWMLYANRYMSVGMPALIVLVMALVEAMIEMPEAERAAATRRFSLSLVGWGGLLVVLQVYGKVRPETGTAATIVFSKTSFAVGAGFAGLGVLLLLRDLRLGLGEGLAYARRKLAARPKGALAALVVAGVVWFPSHAIPFARWAASNAAQYVDEARYTRLGLLIRSTTPKDLRVAVAAAGATPYFSDRPTEDILGKNDRVIAKQTPRGVFSPGHDKWDYEYSLGKRDSKLIVELVDMNDADVEYVEKTLGFEKLPNELQLRGSVTGVDRSILGAPVDDGDALAAQLARAGVPLPEAYSGVDVGVIAAFLAAILLLAFKTVRDDDGFERLPLREEEPPPSEHVDAEVERSTKGANAKQIPTLDGMRGLAVLAVLVFHFAWTYPGEGHGGLAERMHDFLWSGWIGVDLFFVLSGYLITRGLVAPSTRALGTRLKMFWMRRVLRIFPLYYAFVIVGTVIAVALGLGWIPSWHYWLYMQNYTLAFDPVALRWTAHFWSLAIEEQFYFVWPIVALVVPRRRLIVVIVGLVTACVLLRIGLVFKAHIWDDEQTVKFVYRATPTRADGLLLGALAAVLQREARHPIAIAWRRLRFPVLVATGVMLAGLYAVCHGLNDYDRRMVAVGYFTLALFFASAVSMLADGAVNERVRAMLSSRVLVACGKVSYGMYIFHWVLVILLVPRIEKVQAAWSTSMQQAVGLGIIVGGIVAIYGCAWLSFRFFENPFLRLKGKFHD